ncbi:MAG: tetratricopeptide repeat protein [Cyanobacteria bacterium P01_D01_bin.105]
MRVRYILPTISIVAIVSTSCVSKISGKEPAAEYRGYPVQLLGTSDPEVAKEIRLSIRNLRAGKIDAAVEKLTTLSIEQPDNADTHYLLGVAREASSRSSSTWAFSSYEKAHELNPKHPYALLGICSLHYTESRFQDAVNACSKALALDTELVRTKLLLAKSSYFIAQNDPAKRVEALSVLREAVTLRPREPELLRFLALLTLEEDTKAAIPILTQAIKLTPDDGELLFLRGKAYEEKEAYDKALQDYRRAVIVAPTQEAPYRRAEKLLNSQGRFEEAHRVKIQADARFN